MRKYFIVGFVQNNTKWFLGGSLPNTGTSYAPTVNERQAIQFDDKSAAIRRLRDFVLDKRVERIMIHQVEETII